MKRNNPLSYDKYRKSYTYYNNLHSSKLDTLTIFYKHLKKLHNGIYFHYEAFFVY